MGGVENMRGLWRLAKYDLVKYLFDDDLLMPHALGDLADEVAAAPDATFVFGRRQTVDARGRLLDDTMGLTAQRARMDQHLVAKILVGGIRNPIGEFSNILINRSNGVTETDFISYRGFEMHVVTDVGFFLNATRLGPCVGLGRLIGSFRKHANQNSSPAENPSFAIGIFEWELFIRGEYSCGALQKDVALAAIDKLAQAYVGWSPTLPLLGELSPGVAQLRARVEAGETAVLDDGFRQRWDGFVQAVLEAKSQKSGASVEAAARAPGA